MYSLITLAAYYLAVYIYVLGIRMHLSAPRITKKLPLTDLPNVYSFILQVAFAFWCCNHIELHEAMILIVWCLTLSALSFAVLEVIFFVSPISILLQISGMLLPSLMDGSPLGYSLSIICLIISKLVNDIGYEKRYRWRIQSLHKIIIRKYINFIPKISEDTKNVCVAILLCEMLCRPSVFRKLEIVAKKTIYRNRAMSTGVMQVTSRQLLSDKESVILGSKMIGTAYRKYEKMKNRYERTFLVAYSYNKSCDYADYVASLYYYLLNDHFYTHAPYKINPKMLSKIVD